jgi:hypothetical protein
MQVKPFFVVFPVLVGVIIYAYYAPKDKPERATTLTPKQYIELVEKKKLEKKQVEKEQSAEIEQPGTKSNSATTPNK